MIRGYSIRAGANRQTPAPEGMKPVVRQAQAQTADQKAAQQQAILDVVQVMKALAPGDDDRAKRERMALADACYKVSTYQDLSGLDAETLKSGVTTLTYVATAHHQLRALSGGDDDRAVQDRLDIARHCFGVKGLAELAGLPVEALQVGIDRLQHFREEKPPWETDGTLAEVQGDRAGGKDDVPLGTAPETSPAGDPAPAPPGEGWADDDATEALVLQLREGARREGTVIELEELIEPYRQKFTEADGVFILTKEEREELLEVVRSVLPAVAQGVELL